jgi:lipocalin
LGVFFQYLGAWYELYRIPNAAEDDLSCEAERLFKTENGVGIETVGYDTR